jgi:hypothetical protein
MDKVMLVSPLSLIEPGLAVGAMASETKDSLYNIAKASGAKGDLDDFLYFGFKLCHVGRNSNKDIFLLEEMEKDVLKPGKGNMPAWRTPIDEPIDYDHNFGFPAIVGDIYDSSLVREPEDAAEKPYIKCAGLIYRSLYPDVAFKVARGSRLGYAKVSMEVKFASGIVGHEGRVLRGLNFKGAALTRMPADIESEIDQVPHNNEAQAGEPVRQIAVGTSIVQVPKGFLTGK